MSIALHLKLKRLTEDPASQMPGYLAVLTSPYFPAGGRVMRMITDIFIQSPHVSI